MTQKILTAVLIYLIITCPLRCKIGAGSDCCGNSSVISNLPGAPKPEDQNPRADNSRNSATCCCAAVEVKDCETDLNQSQFDDQTPTEEPVRVPSEFPNCKCSCLCGGAILNLNVGPPSGQTVSELLPVVEKLPPRNLKACQSSRSPNWLDPGRLSSGRVILNLNCTLLL